jgi:hypothetical protein
MKNQTNQITKKHVLSFIELSAIKGGTINNGEPIDPDESKGVN